jgi:hypothetical protein
MEATGAIEAIKKLGDTSAGVAEAIKEQGKAQDVTLISGEPISLASENLRELVKGVVSGRGGTISSERIGKPEDLEKPTVAPPGAATPAAKDPAAKKATKPVAGPKLQVLSVSIDSVLPDTSALSDILYSLETRTPFKLRRSWTCV